MSICFNAYFCFSVPFKLQEGEVRIISLEKCQSYFDMKTITSRMLCAGYESGTVDSCMVGLMSNEKLTARNASRHQSSVTFIRFSIFNLV